MASSFPGYDMNIYNFIILWSPLVHENNLLALARSISRTCGQPFMINSFRHQSVKQFGSRSDLTFARPDLGPNCLQGYQQIQL